MEQTSNASVREGEQDGKRRRALLALLLLLVLITTSMVGYVLGRSASGPLGQAGDTIVLSPQPSGRTTAHLTGQVVYTDGSPAAGLKLELHSDPIEAQTDAEGTFLFPNASFGSHRILVYGPDGAVAAERPLSIGQNAAEEGVSISESPDGGSAIALAVNVRMLEVVILLDGEGGLEIVPTGCTYADGDGLVVTPTGSVTLESGAVVTPKGSVLLPDGTIVIPRSGENAVAVIMPDDQVVYLEQEMKGDGYSVQTDGTVRLSGGTVVRPGGQIVAPDGTRHDPGEGGVIVEGGAVVTPIGGGSSSGSGSGGGDSSTGGSAGGAAGGNAPSTGGTVGGGTTAGGGTTGGGTTPGGNAPGDTPPGGGDTPDTPGGGDSPGGGETLGGDTPPSGSLAVHGQNRDGGFSPWTQISTIDLFYNKTSGQQEKIAPGSSGYYLFRLQNTLANRLNVTVSLAEDGLHLPLELTLTPLDANGRAMADRAVTGSLSTAGGLNLRTDIAGSAVASYRLDWSWPAEGNDELDTLAGSGGNLVYLLAMTVHAEEA